MLTKAPSADRSGPPHKGQSLKGGERGKLLSEVSGEPPLRQYLYERLLLDSRYMSSPDLI